MTNIIIGITAWYLKGGELDEFKVDYEADVPDRYGFVNSFKGLSDIAEAVLAETQKRGIVDPIYKIILDKGPFPLKKVSKNNDYERYSAKPGKKIKEELARLLQNGIMNAEEEYNAN